jgi:hypothetical protein
MKQTTSNRGVVAVKQLHMLVKVAVVASSLLLVGGFVSYRAGAFDALMGPSAQPAEPTAPQQPPPGATESAPAMMSSSKSLILSNAPPYQPPATPEQGAYKLNLTVTDPPGASQSPPPATTKAAPTIMSGSKASFGPVIKIPDSNPATPPTPAPNQPSKPGP